MKTYLECVPCLLRQTVAACRMLAAPEAVQDRLVRNVLTELASADLSQPPPVLAQGIHRQIRELSLQKDPYRWVKKHFTDLAVGLLDELTQTVEDSPNPPETALRLAIAGNVIDLGVTGTLSEAEVFAAIEHALAAPLQGDPDELLLAAEAARKILYLADNAGEIVFDRLLLQQLPLERVTLAVKGAPVINDAVREDAVAAGIDALVEVIDNGADVPGTLLAECSENFLRHFAEADLVIAKGQGNYETLNDVPKDIFFILKAKCPVIARDLGCNVGDLILRRSTHQAKRGQDPTGLSDRTP
ncbi:damage-control phosphatase ARMT1 family protein [Desulfuromonas acetexigens]|uniref:DUF89 family protein n=1 Tax=Trichloromonas acetexigens TaxID=38815 RepID=A0A550JFD9_9BACT|nr:ARMT1-like domain-containing protein [Desulfuromonas acetexigens]TRO81903.1 DUF89 family protein [Desulfuromonas acetexigens]